MPDPFWSVHTHTRFSAGDAIGGVGAVVDQGVVLGYPAMGMTDHGTMAGAVQFYLACRKAGISPLPGMEMYFTFDAGAKEKRSMHLTIAAYTSQGYRNLVRLSTLAHRNFYQRPRVDAADLAGLAFDGFTDGLLLGTGCRSGPIVRALIQQGPKAAQRVAENFAMWFPRVYIEVMNHAISAEDKANGGITDDEITDALVQISERSGLPLLVTSDSHYVVPEERALHDAMKSMLSWSEDPADGTFSGTGYHLVDRAYLADYFEPKVLEAGIASLTELAEKASVTIPELDTFTLKVPDVTYGGDPDVVLAKRVLAACEEQFPGDEEHMARAIAELEVIEAVNFAGYLLCVAMLTDHMSEVGIWFYARGSVGGSLATFLLGISQDDPLVEGVRMDRFLSGDRTTPPDIDLDVEDARRAEIIAWVSEHFAVRQVANYVNYGLDIDFDTQTGSLKVSYFSTRRKQGYSVDEKSRIPPEDWEILTNLASRKLIKNVGTNAAGFLLATHESDLDVIPMVRIGNGGSLVTAFDKDDVEPIGFPKIDLLGSRTLRGLRIMCTLIDPESPREYFDAIVPDDPATMSRIRAANTTGVFQLGGYTQRKGMEELQPTTTADVIAAQALYRTGVSKEFLGTYLRRRRGEESVPPVHADIMSELAPTFGVALFQEQVVGILRNIGMEPAELTAMLKAAKASGKAGLVKAQEAVRQALPEILVLGRDRGWSDDDVAWLEAALTDYAAGYSFGKAHSVRYGKVAYRCAWLVCHEPLAFWTGMLRAYTNYINQRKEDVEAAYVRAAKNDAVRIVPAHVNTSGIEYEPDPEKFTIRTGLISVSGVGVSAAMELVKKAPYATLRDLGQRVSVSKISGAKELAISGALPTPKKDPETGELKEPGTVIWRLHKAGALKGLT